MVFSTTTTNEVPRMIFQKNKNEKAITPKL